MLKGTFKVAMEMEDKCFISGNEKNHDPHYYNVPKSKTRHGHEPLPIAKLIPYRRGIGARNHP